MDIPEVTQNDEVVEEEESRDVVSEQRRFSTICQRGDAELVLTNMLMPNHISQVMEDVWGPIQLPVKYPRGFARASRPSI